MAQLLCCLLRLKCARLTDVCRDSHSFFPKLQPQQRCLMVAGTVTLRAELPPSPSPLAAQGSHWQPHPAQQLLDVSRDKPPLLHQNSVSAHTDVATNLACQGGKTRESQPACGRVSCCCSCWMLGSGSSSWGKVGASPARVSWAL